MQFNETEAASKSAETLELLSSNAARFSYLASLAPEKSMIFFTNGCT